MGIFEGFLRKYHEGSVPVRDGVPSANEGEEIDAWPMRRDPKNTVSSGGYRVLDSETGDSRRGAGGPGYPVDKSDPEDPMEPGWNGDALDDEEERALRVSVRCSACGETSKVRLPNHIRLAKTAYAAEGESGKGRIMRTRCACGETVRFHAPEGYAFAKRESAAFMTRYNYLAGRGPNPIMRGLRSAREAFRRSYYGR